MLYTKTIQHDFKVLSVWILPACLSFARCTLFVGYEVLLAVRIEITYYRVITSCSLVPILEDSNFHNE